ASTRSGCSWTAGSPTVPGTPDGHWVPWMCDASGVREVDRYVAGLGAALRGPRRVKADLLVEARDSLVDAAEAYRAEGATQAEADRQAVAEFGTLAEIVPAYQAELAVAQGRRTALLIALALP